jgi:hypothetical protein
MTEVEEKSQLSKLANRGVIVNASVPAGPHLRFPRQRK